MTTKIVDMVDARAHLMSAGSRLDEALDELLMVTQNKRFINSLKDYELDNLRDVYHRVAVQTTHVDVIIEHFERRIAKAAKKVKAKHP